MTDWEKRNPFLDDFLREEVEWYGKPEGVKYIRPQMRCDDYLNVNFRLDPGFDIPILVRDNIIWMSLTWMEVQSAWLAIKRAHGHAATIGLGLGYFTLRAVEKSEVKRLTVFEQDADNITWFHLNFKHRPGFEKIEFVPGDARETCRDYHFDTMFADHYPVIGDEKVAIDAVGFKTMNVIDDYRFWGYERFVADAFEHHEMVQEDDLCDDHRLYFDYWQGSECGRLRRDVFDERFVEQVIEAMEWEI